MSLKEKYSLRYKTLVEISQKLQEDLSSNLIDTSHIDRINARPKSVERFLRKSKNRNSDKSEKYSDPLNQIQDQVGARIIVFYLDDIEIVETVLRRYYQPIEEQLIIPDSEKEFGYEGKHFIFLLPSDVVPDGLDTELIPDFFELQIKTLYQHAFSEASHDLAYKPGTLLTSDQKRKVAFASAQSWGADQFFSQLVKDIFSELN